MLGAVVEPYESSMRRAGAGAVREAERFFVREGAVHRPLDRLVAELASGMTHADRLGDLADVQESIRELALDSSFAERPHPYVRAEFLDLWRGVASSG
jgi:hypothetical protein